jgi:hypothetical protein
MAADVTETVYYRKPLYEDVAGSHLNAGLEERTPNWIEVAREDAWYRSLVQ